MKIYEYESTRYEDGIPCDREMDDADGMERLVRLACADDDLADEMIERVRDGWVVNIGPDDDRYIVRRLSEPLFEDALSGELLTGEEFDLANEEEHIDLCAMLGVRLGDGWVERAPLGLARKTVQRLLSCG